jgi:predicted nucleic acid-binding protein
LKFDLAGALRSIKPQRLSAPLARRPDVELPWAVAEPLVGAPLLLDTTVYLDVLGGRSPDEADNLLRFRICNHSAVCLAELTHAFGRLDPRRRDTKSTLKILRDTIADIPAHRLHAPDTEAWGAAGMLAGTLFRLGGLPAGQGLERKLLNDALLYLQARKLGCAVLTANIRDFDFLNQLAPGGRFVVYKRAPS